MFGPFHNVEFDGITLRMLFDIFIILGLLIIFLVAFCAMLQKLRNHYETEARRNPETPASTGHTNAGLEADGDSGIYPSNLSPPPYTQYDIPPNYEEVIRNMEKFPKVHADFQIKPEHLIEITTQK